MYKAFICSKSFRIIFLNYRPGDTKDNHVGTKPLYDMISTRHTAVKTSMISLGPRMADNTKIIIVSSRI